jgi:hypothetical protein
MLLVLSDTASGTDDPLCGRFALAHALGTPTARVLVEVLIAAQAVLSHCLTLTAPRSEAVPSHGSVRHYCSTGYFMRKARCYRQRGPETVPHEGSCLVKSPSASS